MQKFFQIDGGLGSFLFCKVTYHVVSVCIISNTACKGHPLLLVKVEKKRETSQIIRYVKTTTKTPNQKLKYIKNSLEIRLLEQSAS